LAEAETDNKKKAIKITGKIKNFFLLKFIVC
jgi:hypothetical protein